MVYKAIGIMSGSSLNGLDIVYVHFHETAGKWSFEIMEAECSSYSEEWIEKLKKAVHLSALDYQLLHVEYGQYIGNQINAFINKFDLHHKVHLVASHGHTTFHLPAQKMSAQLGDGASIAALTRLPIVTDLRALDVASGGQGAPIVPIGEKLLLEQYDLLLNLGGIANISLKKDGHYKAFDVCPANRVLNMLANKTGKEYDDKGAMASTGSISEQLLISLNAQPYYSNPFPKSLSNDFGTDIIYPLIENTGISLEDGLRTYVEHIIVQVKNAIEQVDGHSGGQLLVTGGGAFNEFLVERLSAHLQSLNISVVIPDVSLVTYKEAMIMALIGVLRWREEYNVLSEATGAVRSTVGGALWIGGDA